MNKLYTIAFTVLFSGFTNNLLLGSDKQTKNNIDLDTAIVSTTPIINNISAKTFISTFSTINELSPNVITEERNLILPDSKTYLSFPKNKTNLRDQFFMTHGALAVVQFYDQKITKEIEFGKTIAFGGIIISATLGAAITYAYMKNKK